MNHFPFSMGLYTPDPFNNLPGPALQQPTIKKLCFAKCPNCDCGNPPIELAMDGLGTSISADGHTSWFYLSEKTEPELPGVAPEEKPQKRIEDMTLEDYRRGIRNLERRRYGADNA